MPELPEVETIVNDLKKKIVGRKIVKVWLGWEKQVRYPSPRQFKQNIKGARIVGARRRGKNIIILLDKKRVLLIHLKMTGCLLVVKRIFNENRKHIHLIFYLDNGKILVFSDIRKFGKVLFGSEKEIFNLPDIRNIGPEPLNASFSFDDFKKIVLSRKKKIKSVLMDQKIIAGIGNIYSDEILWFSKIYPGKAAYKLTDRDIRDIYKYTRSVLKQAIRSRGTSISDFKDTSGRPGGYAKKLKVYGREEKPCRRCGNLIKKVRMNSRSASYCPTCQKI